MGVAGKTAIVTGAARGLGREYATRLADAGAAVVAADIMDCSETVSTVEAGGGEAHVELRVALGAVGGRHLELRHAEGGGCVDDEPRARVRVQWDDDLWFNARVLQTASELDRERIQVRCTNERVPSASQDVRVVLVGHHQHDVRSIGHC